MNIIKKTKKKKLTHNLLLHTRSKQNKARYFYEKIISFRNNNFSHLQSIHILLNQYHELIISTLDTNTTKNLEQRKNSHLNPQIIRKRTNYY